MKGSEKSNFLFFDNISVFIGKILKEKNILKLIVKWSLNIHTENADGFRNNNKERRKNKEEKNWKRKCYKNADWERKEDIEERKTVKEERKF